MPCLECQSPLTASKRGHARRFCSLECKRVFNNRRAQRGMLLYDLVMGWRLDRQRADELGIRNHIHHLVMRFREEDAGRKMYKPLDMALGDIDALDIRPVTNLFLKEA